MLSRYRIEYDTSNSLFTNFKVKLLKVEIVIPFKLVVPLLTHLVASTASVRQSLCPEAVDMWMRLS